MHALSFKRMLIFIKHIQEGNNHDNIFEIITNLVYSIINIKINIFISIAL